MIDDEPEARRVKIDAIFSRKPDRLPFQAYSAAEAAAAESIHFAGVAYASTTARAIHTPMPKSTTGPTREGQKVLPLPEPVAETVSVQAIADALDPVEDADLLKTLRVVLSMEALREHVLAPDYRGDLSRTLRAPVERIRELRSKGYIKKLRNVPPHAFACSLFWVPKSDGKTDRTIFRGNPLNDRCRRPHKTLFVPLPVMLERMTDPEVKWYLSYDFCTWFIELELPPDVACLFVVVLRDGSVWRVVGVPMGWTWAPALAQAVTLGLIRITLRKLPPDVRECVHASFGYLDNVTFALTSKEVAPVVDKCWREVLSQFGVAIKESDTESSASIDWLGVVVTAGIRTASFRPRFMEKIKELEQMRQAGNVITVRAWWRLVALAVHIRWVRQETLTDLITPLRWLSRTAKELTAGTTTWSSRAAPWAGVGEAIARAFFDATRQFAIRAVPMQVIAWGQSDAASTGFRAFVARWPDGKVVLSRIGQSIPNTHINKSETMAGMAGMLWVLEKLPKGGAGGTIDWKTDNTTAEAWIQRRWSSEWEMNEAIAELHSAQVRVNARVMVSHVPGVDCVPDVLTRCTVNPEQDCRAPPFYFHSFTTQCLCVGICAHVATEVQRFARAMCGKSCSGSIQ